jgi:hypothetical protein
VRDQLILQYRSLSDQEPHPQDHFMPRWREDGKIEEMTTLEEAVGAGLRLVSTGLEA